MIENQSNQDGRGVSVEMERLPGVLRLHDGVPVPDRGNGGLHHLSRLDKLLSSQVNIIILFTNLIFEGAARRAGPDSMLIVCVSMYLSV